MPLTMTHGDWMKRTHSIIRKRSDELKAIDNAVLARNEVAAKKALIAWIDDQNNKRQDWHRSVRNESKAVEELYRQLGVLGSAVNHRNISEEMDDKLAKADIRRSQRLAKEKMFAGKTLKFKQSFWGYSAQKCTDQRRKMQALNAAKNVGQTVMLKGGVFGEVASSAYDIAGNIKTIIEAATSTLGPDTQIEVIRHVFGASAAEFAKNAAPVIGMVTSGAQVIQAWVQVAQGLHNSIQMIDRFGDVRAGDASAALQAIVDIIDRQIRKDTIDAGIRTTAFAVKAAGAAADWGTATTAAAGAVESLALLLNMLVDIVIDAKQRDAGNALLRAGNFDIKIFETCPILGCYYVAVQDHSTIMDFDFDNMGKDNWKQEAERLKYAIKPVLSQAKILIDKSRLEIEGMDSAKGVYITGLLGKIKLAYKSRGYGVKQPLNPGELVELVVKGEV